MARTLNDVLLSVTQDYLDKIDLTNIPAPKTVEEEILQRERDIVDMENAVRAPGSKLKAPQQLTPTQVAMIMAKLHPVRLICTNTKDMNEDNNLVALYQFDGEDEGIYVSRGSAIRRLARQYNFSFKKRDFEEVIIGLRDFAPRVLRSENPNLIAVNNGVFDYENKTLLPFTPDLVFLAKSQVNYNPNAQNVIIHNDDDNTDWDVESWMDTLSDDPEIVNLLWEVLGAIIRPLVHWNKSAWFYSETGNNGKGTLCELMRNLCGERSYASISLSEMSKEFALEPLVSASCIITDENDVGTFIDKAANLKAIITNDVLSVNRKNKAIISYRFRGFMVQCLNELPKVKDKSDSFYRRQLFVPFDKCFTGKERKYIKDDYLHRTEVLEYVLKRVLHMNYDKLSEPAACQAVLADYKEYNDPVRQFAADTLPLAKWNLLPFNMLYDAYQVWFKKNMPSGKIQNKSTFINDLIPVIASFDEWEPPDKNKPYKGSDKMSCYEPIIEEYNLTDWMNPKHAKSNSASMAAKCTPDNDQYKGCLFRGIIRKDILRPYSKSEN